MAARLLFLLCMTALASCGPRAGQAGSALIIWAWERPEDLRFADPAIEVAVQTGFVEIAADGFQARGRRFPLKVDRPPTTALVHVQIDHARPLDWTPALRRRVSAAILHRDRRPGARPDRLRRASSTSPARRAERRPPRAAARYRIDDRARCSATPSAVDLAPVDEIVPMVFRMQQGGERSSTAGRRRRVFQSSLPHHAIAT